METVAEERQFCEVKRNFVIFNVLTLVHIVKLLPNLSFNNIKNAYTVARDCFSGKSNSWLVQVKFQTEPKPVMKTIPLTKNKPSRDVAKLMAKYYQASANDDLALAKEFEEFEADIDSACGE